MSLLFSPHAVGPLTLKNRVVIAPMCQYSAVEGVPQPWHVQHLGRLAISGAGLVIVEATGVEAAGRITPDDTGLWNDAQEAAFADILAGIRSYSDTPIGIQLGHAGRRLHPRRLHDDQPRAGDGQPPQVLHVPRLGHALDGRILAHGRDDDPILQGQRTHGVGREQQAHGKASDGGGEAVQLSPRGIGSTGAFPIVHPACR